MNRAIRLVGIALGLVGAILCIAALLGLWTAYPRWMQTIDEVYAEVDKDLLLVEDRIEVGRERVQTVSDLTAAFRTNLKVWATAEAQDPEHAGQRAELISARLYQAREGIEFADSILEKVQSAQRLAHPFKAPEADAPLNSVREQLTVLKERMSQLVDSVDEIRRKFKESGNEAELEKTIENATEELVHVLVVIESLDDRLGRLSSRISEARTQAGELEVDIKSWMWWGRLGSTVLLPWMAVGQIALVVLCWRRPRANSS